MRKPSVCVVRRLENWNIYVVYSVLIISRCATRFLNAEWKHVVISTAWNNVVKYIYISIIAERSMNSERKLEHICMANCWDASCLLDRLLWNDISRIQLTDDHNDDKLFLRASSSSKLTDYRCDDTILAKKKKERYDPKFTRRNNWGVSFAWQRLLPTRNKSFLFV